ncbi:hypothetical protein ACJMK2_026180, partial [Sinanodonta woodiana]
EDIFYKAGCNISLTWRFPITKKQLLEFNIGISLERPVASVTAIPNCDVRDNTSMLCRVNNSNNWLIVVLNLFNVTEAQSGIYKFWKKARSTPEQYLNTSKTLVVIGKPNIVEIRKPIFGFPFEMTCKGTYEQEHYLYRWGKNGVEDTTVYNGNSYNISSLRMNDNFSNVTYQTCLNGNASNLSSVTCENDGCSIDSDSYTIHVLYGPNNVSLSREERHFYLKEYDIFVIDCFANCFPNCIFWWKGRETIENQKLNIIFESRKAGKYACHVTNQQTNVTLISETITLHYAMEAFPGMGLVGAVMLLLVIGVLLVRQWRKIPSGTVVSQVCVQTQTEVSQTELERHNRHIHVPSNTRAMRVDTFPVDNFEPHLLEDHYNTIDDVTLSDDNLGMDLIHKHSHETRRNTEHIHYDYAYSIGICQVETAFTHVDEDTLLTADSNCASPVEIFQDEGNEDHSYLTVTDDSSHSKEMSQDDKADVNNKDKTIISSLNGCYTLSVNY